MNDEQLETLCAAADDGGLDRDGLAVARDGDGYVFETPGGRREGLDGGELREAATSNPWFVSNWYYWDRIDRPETETAFLRWLEDADERGVRERYEALAEGIAAPWGELSITATLSGDGYRRYDLRHRADAGADLETLDVHAGVRELREVVTYDDRGRYRPLKTAPTLQSGWVVPDLDGRELCRAVGIVYPATIENWHLEREGELDVTHYREAAARQTGIYDVVEELPSEALSWAVEACCVDSECLKRRRWDEAETTPIDVPRGDGAFPCRAPCSLFLEAAREWTGLEDEPDRTYTFELTPSEKRQLESVLEAVAEDRIDEIREADFDEGANRYRVRYLRAKRLAPDGRLPEAGADQESK